MPLKNMQQAYIYCIYTHTNIRNIYTSFDLRPPACTQLVPKAKSLMVFCTANPFSPPLQGRGWSQGESMAAASALLTCRNTLHELLPFCFAKLSRPRLFSCTFIGLFPCREAAVRGERVCFSVHGASNLLFEVVCQNHIPASASSPSRGEAEIRN